MLGRTGDYVDCATEEQSWSTYVSAVNNLCRMLVYHPKQPQRSSAMLIGTPCSCIRLLCEFRFVLLQFEYSSPFSYSNLTFYIPLKLLHNVKKTKKHPLFLNFLLLLYLNFLIAELWSSVGLKFRSGITMPCGSAAARNLEVPLGRRRTGWAWSRGRWRRDAPAFSPGWHCAPGGWGAAFCCCCWWPAGWGGNEEAGEVALAIKGCEEEAGRWR
jgi:hypothetical protein